MTLAILCLLIVLAIIVLVKVTKTLLKLALIGGLAIAGYIYVWPRIQELVEPFLS